MKTNNSFFSSLIISFCLLLQYNFSCAQKTKWNKYYGGNHEEYLSDMIPTADNGFILAGSSLSGKSGIKNSLNFGGLDYWIWKMDEFGEKEWEKSYGGKQDDWLSKIIKTRDGGYLLVGTSSSNIGFDKKEDAIGENDIWVLKISAMGVEQWQKTLGGRGNEKNPTIVPTKDGYLVGASSNSAINGNKTIENFGNYDYWILKLNLDGEIQWQNAFGGVYYDELISIVSSNDDGFIIAGNSNSEISGNKTEKTEGLSDYWILKIDSNGLVKWQKTYGSVKDESLSEIIATKDKGYIIAGSSNAFEKSNELNTNFHLINIDEDGTIKWEENYDYGTVDLITTIISNQNNTYTLGGYSKGAYNIIFNKENYKKNKRDTEEYILINLDDKGKVLWDKIIYNEGEDILKKVIVSRDNGYILAGNNNVLQNTKNINRQGNNDFWIVKVFDENQPINELEEIIASPNPTFNYTNIVIGFPYEKGELTINDIMGRQIKTKTVTERMIPIDLSGQAAGIYIISVKIKNEVYSVKVIKE